MDCINKFPRLWVGWIWTVGCTGQMGVQKRESRHGLAVAVSLSKVTSPVRHLQWHVELLPACGSCSFPVLRNWGMVRIPLVAGPGLISFLKPCPHLVNDFCIKISINHSSETSCFLGHWLARATEVSLHEKPDSRHQLPVSRLVQVLHFAETADHRERMTCLMHAAMHDRARD